MTNTSQLRVAGDGPQSGWLAPRLTGRFGAVGLTVPRGFSAYARVFHPAANAAGERVSWAQVAGATGRHAHALMQWDSIARLATSDAATGCSWEGTAPCLGNLDHGALAALCNVLAAGQENEPDCYFCLWEGYGELDSYGWLGPQSPPYSKLTPGERHLFTIDELGRPRLHLPGRGYLLLAGAIRDALRVGSFSVETFWPQSPNLFWPIDQTWCVASEIDFDSTLVGGSDALVEAILGAPDLEAWPVGPDGSLATDADTINRRESGRPNRQQRR